MRLIDADELIYMTLGEDTEKPFRFVPTEFIEDAPTIETVPVIRCKDCKHKNEYGYCTLYLNFHHLTADMDYCSDAERREE